MGKILLTENGVQVWRNFKYIVVVWRDGRMSKPREFSGTILLTTGTEEERTLQLVHPAWQETNHGLLAVWWVGSVVLALLFGAAF